MHWCSRRWRCSRSEAVGVAEAGGVAVVVGDDDRRVERLEVQHQHRVAIETRLRLQDQRDTLRRPLLGSLRHTRAHRYKVQRLSNAQHHRLNTVLRGRGKRERFQHNEALMATSQNLVHLIGQ